MRTWYRLSETRYCNPYKQQGFPVKLYVEILQIGKKRQTTRRLKK